MNDDNDVHKNIVKLNDIDIDTQKNDNNIVANTTNSESLLTLLDKFLILYNTKNHSSGSLFVNIDEKDITATNDKLELFYEYMDEHRALYAKDKKYIDVYEPDALVDYPPNDEFNNELYALIIHSTKPTTKYISLSYISLLYIGINDKYLQNVNWNIINL